MRRSSPGGYARAASRASARPGRTPVCWSASMAWTSWKSPIGVPPCVAVAALASVARNVTDPHVRFVPVANAPHDVDLRAAWRRDRVSPVLRTVLDRLLALDEAA